MLTGANGSLGAILPYCLEPNGVDLGTVGWLTVIPEHMTAATLGGFRSKVSAPVVMRSEGRGPGGCVESARGPEGVLSREEPRDWGHVGQNHIPPAGGVGWK